MNLPYSNPKEQTREEIFFNFYSRLLNWASQLVHHDQAEAEDLVHDLYIQFVRVDRTVETVENIEGYLFTALRNLHYSRMRRAGRDPINDFLIVDYDSVELGLAAVDRRQLLFVRSNLRQICKHACQRKSTARSASILILRFFFGYYPSEVMKITQSSRMAVDRSLQLGRKEARLNLERPNVLRSIFPDKEISVSFAAEGTDTESLFAQFREAIFSACEGECFAEGVLEERYASESKARLTTSELAHLVSCKFCLDRVNRILGLPLLSERSPEDALDHDSHSNSDGSNGPTGATGSVGRWSSATKKTRQRQRLERRVRQLFEHRPASLQIVVDGEVRASQMVTSEISELYLKLGRPEQPMFIEVLSEQGLCILYLQVEQPAYVSGLAQAQSIVLSDDRTLHLSLSFAADVPIIHVVYCDPILSECAVESPSISLTEHDESKNLVIFPNTASTKTVKRNLARRFTLRGYLWMRSLWKSIVIPNMSSLFVSGAVLAIASIVCFSLWMWRPARIAPKTLLQHALSVEAAVETGPSQVIRQRIRISTPKRTLERSIYRDSSGRRHARQIPLGADTARLETALAISGISWDQPLSAESYQNWHDHVQVQSDAVDSTENGMLKLTTTVANGSVLQESLTVRASDFHPIARSVSLRDAGTVEIAELEYEQLPWNEVNQSIFEPLSGIRSEIQNGLPNIHHSMTHALTKQLDEGELDEAELGAMLVLHQLHADGDNRIQVIRRPTGVQVRGIVEDEVRKQELETHLNMVQHVIPAIFTFQELESRSRSNSGGEVQSTRLGLQTDEEQVSPLEKFLLAKGKSQDEMSRVANRLSDSANVINRESEQLIEVLHRYSSQSPLTQTAQNMLDELVAERKASIVAALDEEEQSLSETGFIDIPPVNTKKENLDLGMATEQNYKLCEELVFGGTAYNRSAQDILPELANTIHQLHVATLQLLPSATTRMSARKEQ